MPIENLDVDGLVSLLDAVLNIRAQDGSMLWFRGLKCDGYENRPKIMRFGRTADEVIEREERLITRFRQRSIAYWPAGYPQNDWEQLFAMQHHGLPTRLLDWTENLFIATYFSVLSADLCHSHQDPCTPVVCCVDPVAWNRAMPVLAEFDSDVNILTTADEDFESYRPFSDRRRHKSPVALFGTHNSDRIVAQRGNFMVWGKDTRSLEEVAAENNANLWRIRILGKREKLLADLQAIGFSETMIFPELAALADELARTEGWR